ncbi:hypothetical protein CVU75_01000 [Candidatus Dependentiae bacterium HGW-Dependentiae-1]|nr:MAG: hypothetical protein CVU75_01000 [Candidatus Dependentiae bacterium HGW-Dependentiae-1]
MRYNVVGFVFCFLSCWALPPRISIITSVYNADPFIQGFLQDITQQTIFDQCELILINANSPGNEEAVIQKYVVRYPNIVYRKLDYDPGLYAVWNLGILLARAPYLTNANVDDSLRPDCYALHAQALDEHPEVDLVYSDFYVTYYPNETFAHFHYHHVRTLPEFTPQEILNQPLPNNHPMWRRALHATYGLFDESFRYSGDWEMWTRFVACGVKFMKVPGVLGLYYYNPVGLSTNAAKKFAIDAEDKNIRARYLEKIEALRS